MVLLVRGGRNGNPTSSFLLSSSLAISQALSRLSSLSFFCGIGMSKSSPSIPCFSSGTTMIDEGLVAGSGHNMRDVLFDGIEFRARPESSRLYGGVGLRVSL